MATIEIYSKGYCPYCKMAKLTLQQLGLTFQEYDISRRPDLDQEMRARSQRRTVPQIFIGGVHLGGNDDLQVAKRSGELKALLNNKCGAA